MEIDTFGFARFHQNCDPFESRSENTARTDDVETAPALAAGPSLGSRYIS